MTTQLSFNPFESTENSIDPLAKTAPTMSRQILWGILAVVSGVSVGGSVNMGLVTVGPLIVPLPEGADVSTMETLAESMELMTPVNFLFPYLAHALGTLVGATIAAALAARGKVWFALGIGAFFQAGGSAAVTMLGGPMWFNVLDLTTAYYPMGLLGYFIFAKMNK